MSKAVEYRPLRGPACTTTPEEMFEKLKRRVQNPDRAPVVVVDPPAVVPAKGPVTLEWVTAHEMGPNKVMRPTAHAKISVCGRYTISKACVDGLWVYTVWHVKTKARLKTRIGSFEDAKHFAQEHANAR